MYSHSSSVIATTISLLQLVVSLAGQPQSNPLQTSMATAAVILERPEAARATGIRGAINSIAGRRRLDSTTAVTTTATTTATPTCSINVSIECSLLVGDSETPCSAVTPNQHQCGSTFVMYTYSVTNPTSGDLFLTKFEEQTHYNLGSGQTVAAQSSYDSSLVNILDLCQGGTTIKTNVTVEAVPNDDRTNKSPCVDKEVHSFTV